MSHLFQEFGEKATGQKVCLATTVYDNPDASYTFSMARSREALHKKGIQTAYFLLQGNCHVDDARNAMVREFLESDCTDLLFIDADVSWQTWDLARLCEHDVDIVGGIYPFRREGCETVPVRMKPEVFDPGPNGLMEVDGLPTGFMKIKRHVLERLEMDAKKHNSKGSDRKTAILFERTYEDGVRWGGDLHFCNLARDYGFKIFADYEMTLGHAGKSIIKGSLGSALRKANTETLSHVASLIREGKETFKDLREAREHIGNNTFSAMEDVLTMAVLMARKADGPIIEAGSGLTTILMAAATDQTVYCLEHSKLYAQKLRDMANEAGVTNIGLCVCPVKDGWYDLSGMDLPEHFALGLNDGPPRTIGSRKGFYERFGDKVDVIVADDTDDPGYRLWVSDWCNENERTVDFIERSAVIKHKEKALCPS